MFHRHRWEGERRFYAPPVIKAHPGEIYPRELERMVLGFTVIERWCSCGKSEFDYVLGDVRLVDGAIKT